MGAGSGRSQNKPVSAFRRVHGVGHSLVLTWHLESLWHMLIGVFQNPQVSLRTILRVLIGLEPVWEALSRTSPGDGWGLLGKGLS